MTKTSSDQFGVYPLAKIFLKYLCSSSTFCFEIPGDILLQCAQNQYHLTELYCLFNISSSIESQ